MPGPKPPEPRKIAPHVAAALRQAQGNAGQAKPQDTGRRPALAPHVAAAVERSRGAVQPFMHRSPPPAPPKCVQPMLTTITLDQPLINRRQELEFAEMLRQIRSNLEQIQQQPFTCSDGIGHTIYSGVALDGTQREQIFRYVSKMEVAIGMNEVLRGVKYNQNLKADAGVIIEAIQECGLVTTRPLVLWRKSGAHEEGEQSTIISTSDSAGVLGAWSGAYSYMITVPPGERYIKVKHSLIDLNFNEYLLGPGYFGFHGESSGLVDTTYSVSKESSEYRYDPSHFDDSGRMVVKKVKR